jgi:hypothetical protein
VEAVEWAGTPEAVATLEQWAAGQGRLAREAKAALGRVRP